MAIPATQMTGLTPTIKQAIAQASRKVGVDFDYMVQKAGVESNFDPDIKAKTSSATGLYQFLDQTWLQMVEQTGVKHGLGKYSAAIERDEKGRAIVDDKAMKDEILSLRKDPKTAALMAAEFAAQNQRHLEARGIDQVDGDELYLAHFLGAGGASQFLTAAAKDPNATAADIFPQAAKANKRVFYNDDGKARSFKEVQGFFQHRLDSYAGAPIVADNKAVLNTPLATRAEVSDLMIPQVPVASAMPSNRLDPIAGKYIDPAMMMMMLELKTPDEVS